MILGGKVALVLLVAMMFLEGADPDILGAYNGKIVGLIDPQKKEIIQKRFCRIDYIGHGLYLTWHLNPKDKLEYGVERSLFTKDAKQLPVSVPAGCVLTTVCWFGAQSEKRPSADMLAVPEDGTSPDMSKDSRNLNSRRKD
jgi:hypothetical protein